ncbi:hypothetical protein EG329_010677 [Mollisiaceae sp. DMI_Dod_QoI]|nr:hypothetical protein EG329_010677 [Helotiales sp. DMI_Dod_QoI]
MALFSRSFRRKYLRPRAILLTLTLIFLLDAFFITSFRPTPVREATLPSHLQDRKIFIASIQRNSEYMLRLYWNTALLKLCSQLGPKNVYVSILESGSLEDTKGALRDLEEKLDELGVERRIEYGVSSEEQGAMLKDVPEAGEDGEGRRGWIFTGRGERGWEVRRIPYLAELRNRAMEPLVELEGDGKGRFDTVLWINDVVFSTEDVTTLLATRDGDYAAACALDFSGNSEVYYDTFALRDSSGLKTATGTWPYFRSSTSLRALQALRPIPVHSCWNGLIALDASPFYSSLSSSSTSPLKFRGLPDSLAKHHLEASECCLIHADNPLSATKGVFLNPNVRVAFNASTYSKVNGGVQVKADMLGLVDGVDGGDGRVWPGGWEMVRGMWGNRIERWMGWARVWSEGREVRRRVRKWVEVGKDIGEDREVVGERGVECMVNEMQVLFESGWQHV